MWDCDCEVSNFTLLVQRCCPLPFPFHSILFCLTLWMENFRVPQFWYHYCDEYTLFGEDDISAISLFKVLKIYDGFLLLLQSCLHIEIETLVQKTLPTAALVVVTRASNQNWGTLKNDVNVKFTAACYLAGPGLLPVHTAHQFFSESWLMSNVINFSSLNSLNICSLKWIIFSSSGYICFIVSILNENLVNVTYGKLN